MPTTCQTCTNFDATAHRAEAASLVRCLHDANREGLWFRVVAATTSACRRYDPTPQAKEMHALCDLMML